MHRNVGTLDRWLRAFAAAPLSLCAAFAPLPLPARAVFGVVAAYFLWTALAGTCLGYRLMGKSTCPVKSQ